MIKPSSNSKFLRLLMFFLDVFWWVFGSLVGILLVFGGEHDNVLFFNGIGQIWFKNWFYKELSLILPSDTELVRGYLMECLLLFLVHWWILKKEGGPLVPTRLFRLLDSRWFQVFLALFVYPIFAFVGSTRLRRAVALVENCDWWSSVEIQR